MRPASQALIVIDVQNDFCPGGALAVARGDEIVPRINALMDEFQTVILTQDWHPHDHSSFAEMHEGAAPFTQIEMAVWAANPVAAPLRARVWRGGVSCRFADRSGADGDPQGVPPGHRQLFGAVRK